MKIGIMQPYFVPYIGYWQLMNAVDKYVIYDDVNFIKGGWINRNRILVNGQPKYFNIPMIGASSFKLINNIGVNTNKKLMAKNLRVIEGAYRKAPYYQNIYPLIDKMLNFECDSIAEYIENTFRIICDYLDIGTELIMSSTLNKDASLHGEEQVIAICKMLNATEYYNTIAGKSLYSFSKFKNEGIQLSFIKSEHIQYKQFENEFQSNLSIIDVMMFNDQNKVKEMLNEYTLVKD